MPSIEMYRIYAWVKAALFHGIGYSMHNESSNNSQKGINFPIYPSYSTVVHYLFFIKTRLMFLPS